MDVFHPDYDDPSFRKEFGGSIVGHDPGRVKINFRFELFYRYVHSKNPQILETAFYKKDVKEIERLATLFGLDEEQMADIIVDEYDPHSHPHLDYHNVTSRAEDAVKYKIHVPKAKASRSKVSGDSTLKSKIQMMDEVTPAFFLQVLQNNTEPAKSDLKILNALSSGYGFPNGVINAIIDYTLSKNNNVLSKNYCEKVAASLAREKIETTVDAMNYLNKISTSAKKEVTRKIETPEEVKENKPEEVISDEEMDDILTKLDIRKKGGKK